MRSIYDGVKVDGWSINVNTGGAVVATGVSTDTKGYNTAALRVYVQPMSTGIAAANQVSLVAVLQESTDGSTWTTATDVGGTTIGFTLSPTTTAVVGSARIEGLNTNRDRYLRVQTTAGIYPGVATGYFTSAAVIELGNAYSNPVTSTVSNT